MPPERDELTTTLRMQTLDRPSTGPLPQSPVRRLVCVVGRELGRSYALGNRPVTIGRATDADICLSGDDISRHHARIIRMGGGWVIEDLQSHNGTMVDGIPVKHHVLRVGDRIQIAGSAILLFARHDDLEQRAEQLQKLETLGHLAAVLAHDFKNLLGVIAVNADLLEESVKGGAAGPEELLRGLGDIRTATTAATTVAERLLLFARKEPSAAIAGSAALGSIVEETLTLVRKTFRKRIETRVEIAAAIRVRAERGAIQQLVTNLFLNARDAMPDGGTLLVQAHPLDLDRAQALAQYLPAEGGFVELAVSDTGVGMDEETRTRVFEPFFSTKAIGEGSGLGLFSVFGTVRGLGGSISVESAPGKGATFRVLLPRS